MTNEKIHIWANGASHQDPVKKRDKSSAIFASLRENTIILKYLLLIITISAANFSLAASASDSPYPPGLLENGQARFVAACGFCHGRDAAGGSQGLDLIRSELVGSDVEGNLIGEVVRNGRPNTKMPAFTAAAISDADLQAIVAFLHNQRQVAASLEGGRRSVAPEDVAVGNAGQGERYFDTNCSACHSAEGDLAGIGSRMEGLPLLMRMLYPGSGRRGPRIPAQITVTTADGQRITGTLAYRDEFTVAMVDEAGDYHSWSSKRVDTEVNDPLQGHADLLGRYTDADMHDVLAYLLTLK